MTLSTPSLYLEKEADSIVALKLPERSSIASPNVRQADIDVLVHAPKDFIDTTHFDTVRFPPPDWAVERFQHAANDGSLAYTGYRGNEQVLVDVARNISNLLGVEIDPRKNLVLTPGTQAALFAALSSRVNRGDRVVIMDPDYLFTARMLRFLGAEIAYVPLRLDAAGRYAPDLDALEAEFARYNARHFVFSHPNNPTGTVYPRETIVSISALARQYGVSIVVDELYCRLVYGDTEFAHLAAEDGMMAQTATLLGPSKTESLSGYRLGVLVGNEDLIRSVENVLSITSLRAPAYAQHVLRGWLVDDADWLAGRIAEFKALQKMTADALSSLNWLRLHQQQGTAYLWPDVSALGLPDAEVATALLERAGVLISPGYQFGPNASGNFRVCYAREEKGWSAALQRMVGVLGDLAAAKGGSLKG